MSADGGERRGHTVVRYQSGQHVNRALALIYTRWDPAKVLGMFKTLADWHRPQVSGKRTVLNGMRTVWIRYENGHTVWTRSQHAHNPLQNGDERAKKKIHRLQRVVSGLWTCHERQQSGDSLTGRSERWGDAKWLVGGCYKPGAHVRDPVWARYGNGQNFQQKSIWAVKTVEARSTPGMRPVRTVRRWQRNGEKINFMNFFFLRPGTSSLKTQRSGLCFFLIARQVDGRPTRQSVRAPLAASILLPKLLDGERSIMSVPGRRVKVSRRRRILNLKFQRRQSNALKQAVPGQNWLKTRRPAAEQATFGGCDHSFRQAYLVQIHLFENWHRGNSKNIDCLFSGYG